MVFPPLVPALFSFASAGILGLLWRSLAASARLDESIRQDFLNRAANSRRAGQRNRLETPGCHTDWNGKPDKSTQLNSRLLERSRFVDQALRSVEDGLLIATPEGAIILANRSAGAMLQTDPRALAGQNLFERLGLTDQDLLQRLVVDRARIEREIVIRGEPFPPLFSAHGGRYSGQQASGPVSGMVASLSDVTRQHELQQTKNDVIALVSHEMRTPLTAIQGMTELLAQYEMDPPRRKEISAAINDEVKRLTRHDHRVSRYHPPGIRRDGPAQNAGQSGRPAAARRAAAGAGRGAARHPPGNDSPPALPVLLADADLLAGRWKT